MKSDLSHLSWFLMWINSLEDLSFLGLNCDRYIGWDLRPQKKKNYTQPSIGYINVSEVSH